MSENTVAAAVATVTSHYATELFGVMGNGNALFIDAALDAGLKYNALRHEAGAAAAADAYARCTHQVGVATTTFGAGFTNTLTALSDAVRARSPLVLVTGASPTSGPRPADVEISALVRSVGGTTWTIEKGAEIEVAHLAFESAIRDARPAVISLPYDLADSYLGGSTVSRLASASEHHRKQLAPAVEPDEAMSLEIADIILSAERLLIIGGRGSALSDENRLTARFAEKVSAMTATTVLAHGLVGDYPRHLGIAGGFGSLAAATVMAEADVVLVLGAGLNAHTTRHGGVFGPTATVIQIDTRRLSTSPRVDHYVRLDAVAALGVLLARVSHLGDESTTQWEGYPEETSAIRAMEPVDSYSTGMHPQALSEELATLLPTAKTVTVDGGNFMAWPISAWSVDDASAFVPAGIAFQSIGLGLPAMIGAAIAHPQRLPVLATGDGGLLMSMADFESAVRLIPKGMIVVYNDSAYGAELHQYGPFGLDTGPMTFPTVNFAEIARGFGMQAKLVQEVGDLNDVQDWVDGPARGVLLLDCRIAADVAAPFLSATIAKIRSQSNLQTSSTPTAAT